MCGWHGPASSSLESSRPKLPHRGTLVFTAFQPPSASAFCGTLRPYGQRLNKLCLTPFASAATGRAWHFRTRGERRRFSRHDFRDQLSTQDFLELAFPMAEERWSVARGRPMLAGTSASASGIWAGMQSRPPILKRSSPGCEQGKGGPKPRSAGRGCCPPVLG